MGVLTRKPATLAPQVLQNIWQHQACLVATLEASFQHFHGQMTSLPAQATAGLALQAQLEKLRVSWQALTFQVMGTMHAPTWLPGRCLG